jgi:hypothetical protein
MHYNFMIKKRQHYSLGAQMESNLESKMSRLSRNVDNPWAHSYKNYNYALLYPNVMSYNRWNKPARYVGGYPPLATQAAMQFGIPAHLVVRMTFEEVITIFENGNDWSHLLNKN